MELVGERLGEVVEVYFDHEHVRDHERAIVFAERMQGGIEYDLGERTACSRCLFTVHLVAILDPCPEERASIPVGSMSPRQFHGRGDVAIVWREDHRLLQTGDVVTHHLEGCLGREAVEDHTPESGGGEMRVIHLRFGYPRFRELGGPLPSSVTVAHQHDLLHVLFLFLFLFAAQQNCRARRVFRLIYKPKNPPCSNQYLEQVCIKNG